MENSGGPKGAPQISLGFARDDKGKAVAVQSKGSIDTCSIHFMEQTAAGSAALENQVGVWQPLIALYQGTTFSRATTRPKGQGFSPCPRKIRTNFQ